MKRLLHTALVLLLFTASALGDESWAVKVFSPGWPVQVFPKAPAVAATAEQKAQAFIEANAAVRTPQDTVLCNRGLFDFGAHTIVWLADAMFEGFDTEWYTQSNCDQLGEKPENYPGATFVMGNCTFKKLRMRMEPLSPREDNILIAFPNGPQITGKRKARFQDCHLIGVDWTIYDWGGYGNELELDNTIIEYGRHGISLMGSWAHLKANRVTFDGLATRAQTSNGNATSSHDFGVLAGLVHRGGTSLLTDCVWRQRGAWSNVNGGACPRVNGITDTFHDGPHPNLTIDVVRGRMINEKGSSKEVYDFDIRGPSTKLTADGLGSGLNDAFTYYGKPPVKPPVVDVPVPPGAGLLFAAMKQQDWTVSFASPFWLVKNKAGEIVGKSNKNPLEAILAAVRASGITEIK